MIAVGPGTGNEGGKLTPLDVEASDTILYGKWSGTDVNVDGEEVLIMKEAELMSIVETNVAAKKAA